MANVSQAVAQRWNELHAFVNGRTTFGQVGVRDPENPCDAFDAGGYEGRGDCMSDGHYMCTECSKLSPDAPRFTQSRECRGERLRLFWQRHVSESLWNRACQNDTEFVPSELNRDEVCAICGDTF